MTLVSLLSVCATLAAASPEHPRPGNSTGVRAVTVPRKMELANFLRTRAFPHSKVSWMSGSASLGIEIYRVRTRAGTDLAARFELEGPARPGRSHGSGPWRIVEIGRYAPRARLQHL